MAFGKGSKSVSYEDILQVVSEYDILNYYLGITQIPCMIKAPYRLDNNPSVSLYSEDGRKINFHDFGQRIGGGVIKLLSRSWGTRVEYVLERISDDLPKITANKSNYNTNIAKVHGESRKTYSKTTTLECKVREWRGYDLDFWESFGVSKPWLEFGDVYAISHVILTKKGNRMSLPADKYAYVYVESKDGIITLKIYQPYSQTHKWLNKHDGSVWDLWTKLPETGEVLIITSSRKDALSIWENTGIPSCSLQAESYLPKPQVVALLKSRFKRILVLYDNDFKSEVNYGRLYGQELASAFELEQIEIPLEYYSKDPSDLCKNHGRLIQREVILGLINSRTNNNSIITPF